MDWLATMREVVRTDDMPEQIVRGSPAFGGRPRHLDALTDSLNQTDGIERSYAAHTCWVWDGVCPACNPCDYTGEHRAPYQPEHRADRDHDTIPTQATCTCNGVAWQGILCPRHNPGAYSKYMARHATDCI